MRRIMIVEDDEAIRRELSELLTHAGYETASVKDFSCAKKEILSAAVDLILLDINIPSINGEFLLREIRKEVEVPVIMVTSRTSEADEVLSMSYGADDYITKPYNPTILLLRISAILKRTGKNGGEVRYRDLVVNSAKGVLSREGEELALTKNEMLIFCLLLEHQDAIVSRDDLMTCLWDHSEYVNDNTLTVNISRLRSKLTDFGVEDVIETRKKQGYRLLP